MPQAVQGQLTKMSSRGQIVIPEDIRHSLNLETGCVFVVFGRKESDAILLKKLDLLTPEKAFKEMAEWGTKHGQEKNLNVSPEKIVQKQHDARKRS